MKKFKLIGIIVLALLVAGGVAWVAVPALAKGSTHQDAAFEALGNEAPGPGFGPGPMMMGRAGRLFVNGNVKTVTLDSAGKIQTIVITSLQGKDVTFGADGKTQYRYAPGITGVSVGNFVTIVGRRVPGANSSAGMVIVNSVNSLFVVGGQVTAKGADSFTVKMANKEYVIKIVQGAQGTKYELVTPPVLQPRHGPQGKGPARPQPQGKPQGRLNSANGASLLNRAEAFGVQLIADGKKIAPAARPTPTVTAGTFDDVKVGSMVRVRASGTADNMVATDVMILQPRPAPTPTPTPGANTPAGKGT